jgi:ATP-dependent RNA helicase DBP3
LVANKKQRKEKKEKKSKKEQKSKKEEKIDSPTDNWTCPKSLSINKEANISFLAINEIKIQNLSDEEVKINPILEFSALNLPEKIQKNIVYEKPTPIQSCTWSLLFNHKDVVGIAKTGSGKTMGS